jgi:hypothetical protein
MANARMAFAIWVVGSVEVMSVQKDGRASQGHRPGGENSTANGANQTAYFTRAARRQLEAVASRCMRATHLIHFSTET